MALHNLFHSSDNIGVGTATADIPTKLLTNVIVSHHVPFPKCAFRGTDLPGCAIPALVRVVIDEGLLKGRKIVLATKPLYGGDRSSIQIDRESQATVDSYTIKQNRTGPTLSVVAALFASRQLQRFAEEIQK